MKTVHNIAKAREYAWDRWCIDDPALVAEWLGHWNAKHETLTDFIDGMAEEYDLSDPKEY
jgi:hypothetical protein